MPSLCDDSIVTGTSYLKSNKNLITGSGSESLIRFRMVSSLIKAGSTDQSGSS